MPGTNRQENDIEHSYHLALMAWYLIDSRKLDLDLDKVIKYALAHDLVEIHAGDTYIWSTDEEHLRSKPEREAAAAEKLKLDLGEFPELHATIAEYERRDNPESRFVYALDKILPILLIREEGGSAWKRDGVTIERILENKSPKVALAPEVEPYFHALVELIRKEGLAAES